MTIESLIEEYVKMEMKMEMKSSTFTLLNRLLNERGHEMLITRGSVGENIIAVVKPKPKA